MGGVPEERRLWSMSSGRVRPGGILETHLARVLFSAERRRRTGILTVDEGEVQTRLHLVDGRVVFAEAGTVAETLGRILLKAGTIDRDEYLLILERMSEPSEQDEVLRFGEVAIALGMLEPAQLSEALALQVRSKLARCFLLEDVAWLWIDDEAPRRTTPYPTPLEPTLLEALRRDPQRERWLELVSGQRDRVAHLTQRPDEIARRFVLRAPELRLVAQVEGRMLGDVLDRRVLDPEETAAILVALHLAELLELRAAPLPSKAAAVEIPREDPLREDPSREERAREAAARLREEMKRRIGAGAPEPAGQRARVQAERAFERAKRLFSQGAVERARDLFEEAHRLLPEAADYALHLRWARYLAAGDPLAKHVHEQELRDALLAALKQDRENAFAHHVQGRLLLAAGDERAAERAFAVASRLDPSDVDSVRYLRLLRSRRE